MAKFQLLPDEYILLKSENIMHGGLMASYTDELILTNLNIVYVSKGMLGNTKDIQKFPVNQIKIYNGEPQVFIKKHNSLPQLEIYFLNGHESFGFQFLKKKEINKWIDSIYKLMEKNSSSASLSEAKNDDTLLGQFKNGTKEFDDYVDIKSKKKTNEKVTKKCMSCSAPLIGIKGQSVHCRYCDVNQVL